MVELGPLGADEGKDFPFAKLKALLRKAAARTVNAFENAVAKAIDTYTPTECANDFTAAASSPS